MNKTDIDYTEPKQATISLVVGDEVVDKNDNKATVFYIDYYDECVVLGSDGNSATVSFNIIAGGDYQQVVGDQIMGYYVPIADVSPDIRYQRMSIENIGFSPANIDLVVGDDIADYDGNIYEVAYIDYARENIITVNFSGDVSDSRVSVLKFGDVACSYLKVTEQKV